MLAFSILPGAIIAAFEPNMAFQASNPQQLLEQFWQSTASNLARGCREVVLPEAIMNALGQAGVDALTHRFRFVLLLEFFLEPG